MSTFTKYVSVILDVALDKSLDYGVPTEWIDKVRPGMRVEVPVRGHQRQGYIVIVKDRTDFPKVQPLGQLLQEDALIQEELLELARWMEGYYCTPLRQVLKILIPAPLRGRTKAKEQLFVMRAKTREELQELCAKIRNTYPAQAEVLDVMLQVSKGILLSELLERTQGTRSPVDTLTKKGALQVDIVRVDRSPLTDAHYLPTKPKALYSEQAAALAKIASSLTENRFATHLLHGVTGSGKTEVYLQAIKHALSLGKGTIMLLPEIALTEQTIERFRSRFEGRIAILHHRLSDGERYDEWQRIRRGEAPIVIGARSAIFSPLPHLGLIIVDEEHDHSYKQSDEMPCYHARDVAVMRSKMCNATVILGSATPSLESYYNAHKGKYTLSKLGIRADSATLPTVKVIDMTKEFEKAKGFTSFSEPLIAAIKKRYAAGEQTILFLNRRGYHTTLLCQQCRQVLQCRHCDVPLTFHRGDNHLSCHLCDFTLSPPPKACPGCHSPHPLKFKGVGTEQIERALHALLPEIRTLRIDGDTTRHKGSHQKLFRAFATGKADVLIGTQMVTKGLHFPSVTLVGVINSDSSLQIPDFRASETVFQLITQVAGRAGRGALAGEVIVQTALPTNATIQIAAEQNYEKFFEQELASRQLFQYPPFTQLIKLTFAGKDPTRASRTAQEMRQQLISHLPSSVEVTPSLPAAHAKVKDRYRFQFLLRGPTVSPMTHAIEQVQKQFVHPRSIRLRIDVNPTSTFF